jgi:hypothetical protein
MRWADRSSSVMAASVTGVMEASFSWEGVLSRSEPSSGVLADEGETRRISAGVYSDLPPFDPLL